MGRPHLGNMYHYLVQDHTGETEEAQESAWNNNGSGQDSGYMDGWYPPFSHNTLYSIYMKKKEEETACVIWICTHLQHIGTWTKMRVFFPTFWCTRIEIECGSRSALKPAHNSFGLAYPWCQNVSQTSFNERGQTRQRFASPALPDNWDGRSAVECRFQPERLEQGRRITTRDTRQLSLSISRPQKGRSTPPPFPHFRPFSAETHHQAVPSCWESSGLGKRMATQD